MAAAGAQREKPAAASRKSLRERVGALRNLPPFLRQIWTTSRAMTSASLALRLLRALLPVATLYVGKLIIDEALRLVGLHSGLVSVGDWIHSGLLSRMGWLLLLELSMAVLSDVLGRIVGLIDSLLSELVTNASSV